jgi:dGTPase
LSAPPSSGARATRYAAAYTSNPERSRGRWFAEPPARRRTAFERDRDRVIHATAFRRLKGKTQVFLATEGDHYRTRLTHTLEVSQIARALARALFLDEDLTEAIALAHDLGHPPFGHAGERALDAAMAPFGGFDHNVQSLRVVTRLERRYPGFDGLNLTWETIEGLAKHNGPVIGGGAGASGREIAPTLAELSASRDLLLWSHPSLEAQCAAIADDIAYDAHDIDDGLRAGLLTLDGLRSIQVAGDLVREIERELPGLERARLVPELVRRLISWLVEDALVEAERRIRALAPRSPEDARSAGSPLVAFSGEALRAEEAIKQHLAREVYRSPAVMAVMGQAEAVVTALFERYAADPKALPEEWRSGLSGAPDAERGRRIADFLAGMTDRFALSEYKRLFDRVPDFG